MENNYKVEFIRKIDWGDMDAFGHVNNTVYLKYFESARVRYFENIPELANMKGGDVPVVVNLSCSYRKPVTYPDNLIIRLGVVHLGGASIKMACDMISEKEGLAAQAECVIVLVDSKKNVVCVFLIFGELLLKK